MVKKWSIILNILLLSKHQNERVKIDLNGISPKALNS